jgi:hypothetical protein
MERCESTLEVKPAINTCRCCGIYFKTLADEKCSECFSCWSIRDHAEQLKEAAEFYSSWLLSGDSLDIKGKTYTLQSAITRIQDNPEYLDALEMLFTGSAAGHRVRELLFKSLNEMAAEMAVEMTIND